MKATGMKLSRFNSKALLLFLGLTICYQIVYQAFMLSRIIESEQNALGQCEPDSPAASSPQCLEIQLFRSWEKAALQGHVGNESEEDLERLARRLGASLSTSIYSPTEDDEDAEDEDEDDVVNHNESSSSSNMIIGVFHPIVHFGTQERLDKIYNDTMALLNNRSNITAFGQSLVDMQADLEARMEKLPSAHKRRHQKFLDEFDRMYNASMAKLHNRSAISTYAQGLLDIQAEFEAKKEQLPSTKRARKLERQEKIDRLYKQTLEAIQNSTNVQNFAKDLQAIRDNFDAKKRRLPSSRRGKKLKRWEDFDKMYNDTMAAIHSRPNNITPWGQKVLDSQARMERTLQELEERHEARKAGKKASGKNQTLLEQIFAFGRELCDTELRRNRPACVQFLVPQNASAFVAYSSQTLHPSKAGSHGVSHTDIAAHAKMLDTQLARIRAGHKEWQQEFASNASEYFRALCSEPVRSSYPVCKKLHGEAAATTPKPAAASSTSSSSLRGATGYLARLSWTALKTGLTQSFKRGFSKSLAVLRRNDLATEKWQGRIPTVACVAAVPAGPDTATKLRHFVANFRQQEYEGLHHLILLYRSTDQDVAQLVKEHADGTFVKAVAVPHHGEFPSTTALRYGAWSAGASADIIARWNFEEWHHPQRLAMQVRALAKSARPVSVLKRWTVLRAAANSDASVNPTDATEETETVLSDELGWEGSLVGEASWMREHWMPLLGDERGVLSGVQAGNVVQVDMPELLVYTADEAGAGAWQQALSHFGEAAGRRTASLDVGAVCTGVLSNSNTTEELREPAADLAVDMHEKVGAGLADMYRELASKRRYVQDNLYSLCLEASRTKEDDHRGTLVSQAEHIASIQAQISSHFDSLHELYNDTATVNA